MDEGIDEQWPLVSWLRTVFFLAQMQYCIYLLAFQMS